MSQGRFVSVAVAVGVAIPAAWLMVYWVFMRGNAAIMSAGYLPILSVIWPSWLLLMADPEERSVAIPAASIAVNALLYGIVGWLIWFGLNRSRLVLAAVAAALIVGWYLLLRWLYVGT
jgi:hypothetical protein